MFKHPTKNIHWTSVQKYNFKIYIIIILSIYIIIILKSRLTYRKCFHRKEQRAMAEIYDSTDASLAADLLHSFWSYLVACKEGWQWAGGERLRKVWRYLAQLIAREPRWKRGWRARAHADDHMWRFFDTRRRLVSNARGQHMSPFG